MQNLTPDGRKIVDEIAQRNAVSSDAVFTLLTALMAGGGTQAQFSHRDLGGMGQWSQGGMTMVGDMFNNGLKYKVDSLCNELSGLLRSANFVAPSGSSQSQSQNGQSNMQYQGSGQFQGGQFQGQGGGGQFQSGGGGVSLFVPGSAQAGNWWPEILGSPASVGAQNNLRYAYFPSTQRLAIDMNGRVTVYDTGDNRIGGFSQQQSGDQSLTFTSQYGLVRVADLPIVNLNGAGNAFQPQQQDPIPAYQPPAPFTQPEPHNFQTPAPYEPAPQQSFMPQPNFAPPPAPQQSFTPTPSYPPANTPAFEDDIFAKIERLADLFQKGVLTQAEFDAKKTDLLSRL